MDCHQADAAEQAARRSVCNDRRVLNGIFWVLRSGAPWRDPPETYRTKTFSCSTRCGSEAYFYIVEMTVRSKSTTRGGL
jgi:transposase